MSLALLGQVKDLSRQVAETQQLLSSCLQALKAAEDRIKALENKRGPGRPPNEPRSSD